MAKKCYLRAGDLGIGEGYSRLAEIYTDQGEWDEARLYFRKAADRMNVIAIYMLGGDALLGCLRSHDGRESPSHPPDLKEAFRLFREGASLGHAECCYYLGHCFICFMHGYGTKESLETSFKWFQKAMGKGHVDAMLGCGRYYLNIAKSNAQAKYWFEKALESEKGTEEQKREARGLLRTHNL